MEDNFRNVLIILSGIVIGAIFIHGLWTIRKQKNPYKLKASKDKVEPLSRNFDGKGFDQDGVGQVIVKKTTSQEDDEAQNSAQHFSHSIDTDEMVTEPNLVGNVEDEPNNDLDTNLNDDLSNNLGNDLDGSLNEQWFESDSPKKFSKDELGDDLTPIVTQKKVEDVVSKPVYKQPVTNAKPAISPTRQSIRPSIKKSPTTQTLKRNQMEINFGDVKMKDEPMPSITADASEKQTGSVQEHQKSPNLQANSVNRPTIEPQVIIISVVMPENQQMLGAALLPSLLTLGLKYGDMNIFHRHQDNAGNGEVCFSLANMMKPGSFDLDTMETFATQGISLFMTLPNAADPFAVFDQMLSAAKQLAQEFNAQVLDDKRHVMTQQAEQNYVSKIRDFDRKSRISVVE